MGERRVEWAPPWPHVVTRGGLKTEDTFHALDTLLQSDVTGRNDGSGTASEAATASSKGVPTRRSCTFCARGLAKDRGGPSASGTWILRVRSDR